MSGQLVNRDDRGPVAVFTLNRPERRNALSRALMAQLRDALDEVGVDVRIRAIVVTGAGTAFCAGMDLKEAAAIDTEQDSEQAIVAAHQEFADLLHCIHSLPKPIIAAVNEVRRGMVAAIVMHDLSRQVGDRRARQLLLGGELISSKLASEWGLINAVTPADRCLDEAIRMAEGLVGCAPLALATTKRLLDEAEGRPPNLRGAAAISAVVRTSEEAQEGIRAFIEKRPPRWVKPPSSRYP
jgi:methylglutaconyl-CoA hydratase